MNIKLNIYVVAVVYFFINVALLIYAPYDVHLTQGADSGSWYDPALSLLKHGTFVTLNDPTILQTYRPPLYPIYEAIMLFIGSGSIISIIIGQIVLLWLTGVIVYKIVENISPGKGLVGLSLIIFNPNTLGTAHLVQSDILYMFMMSTTLFYLILYDRNGNFKLSFIVGLLFGLTCLVRPSGQYLIPLFPAIYIIIGVLRNSGQSLLIHFYHGLLSIIVAVVVVFPWAQHNASAGWGYNLATSEIEVVYFKDNVIYLESILNNKSLKNSESKITQGEHEYIASYPEKWLQMSKQDRSSTIASYYKQQLFTYDYKTVIKGFVDSWIGLFGAGGAANLHNVLALSGNRSIQVMAESKEYASRVDAVLSTLMTSNLVTVVISLFSFAYVIILRVFGLVGLIKMIRNREYGVLFILSGVVTYFMLIALFVGNSRYRLPIEPALIVMAVYGLNVFIKKRNTSGIK